MYQRENQGPRHFVGIPIHTSNATHQKDVPALWERVFQERSFEHVANRKGDLLFAVYTDYEGNYTKPYTYMVACEVSKVSSLPSELQLLTVPAQSYALFANRGPFPDSLVKSWQQIWDPKIDVLRAYATDFEVYPADFSPEGNAEIRVYISLTQ